MHTVSLSLSRLHNTVSSRWMYVWVNKSGTCFIPAAVTLQRSDAEGGQRRETGLISAQSKQTQTLNNLAHLLHCVRICRLHVLWNVGRFLENLEHKTNINNHNALCNCSHSPFNPFLVLRCRMKVSFNNWFNLSFDCFNRAVTGNWSRMWVCSNSRSVITAIKWLNHNTERHYYQIMIRV